MRDLRWLVLIVAGMSACNHPPLKPGGFQNAGAGGTTGSAGTNVAGEGGSGGMPVEASIDLGRSALRRLTNLEYDNTVRDLLGLPGPARATFQPDEVVGDFDVIGDGQTWNDARYEQYFDTAESLAAAAFADPTLRKRIMKCETADGGCLSTIVTSFGLRAWRRPLASDEVTSLVGLATAALADGATLDEAIQRVVTALLSSAPFLMHLELDPNPSSTLAHPLSPYELVSRLSYLLWSSMPDDDLLAVRFDTMDDATLEAVVDSMLNDPNAEGFVESFAAQWLHFAQLTDLQIEPALDPAFSQALRDALGQELRLYFGAFLRPDGADFRTFPTADVNYVNGVLAPYYGVAPPASPDTFTPVADTGEQRTGFLGLGGFLTMTSVSGRSSPTERGAWILAHLLCQTVPTPPVGTPDYISPAQKQTGDVLVAATHAQSATCAACHDPMDGVGVTLEGFDELGRFRTVYPDGTPVDTRGTFAGQPVDGEPALAAAVAQDPRFLTCVSRELMSFAVNRTLLDVDTPYANQILTKWQSGTPTLRALLKAIVTNDTFKLRRGEGP